MQMHYCWLYIDKLHTAFQKVLFEIQIKLFSYLILTFLYCEYKLVVFWVRKVQSNSIKGKFNTVLSVVVNWIVVEQIGLFCHGKDSLLFGLVLRNSHYHWPHCAMLTSAQSWMRHWNHNCIASSAECLTTRSQLRKSHYYSWCL